MKRITKLAISVLIAASLYGCASTSEPQGESSMTYQKITAASLTGTSWQLVKFEGSDGKIINTPEAGRYTMSFGEEGRVAAKIFCNRGGGSWTFTEPSELKLGPLALTRAFCPDDQIQNKFTRDWSLIRSAVMKDGRLYLSLMADGGGYEFEPMPK